MDSGSTLSLENRFHSILYPSTHQNSESPSEFRAVNIRAVDGVGTVGRNITPNRGGQQDSNQRLRPKSEPLFVFETNRPPGASLGELHMPYRHSVHSNIKNLVTDRDGGLNESLGEENQERNRSLAFGVRKNAVSPVVFVQRWAKTRLPRDELSGQLQQKLAAATVKNHLLQRFIPEQKLREIVTAETVCTELEKSNYSNFRRIHTSPVTVQDGSPYQKILAILYMIKQPSKIRLFVKNAVCDTDLPLFMCQSAQKNKSCTELKSKSNPKTRPIVFKRRDYAHDFFDTQWRVLAHIFASVNGDRMLHSVLEPESILPFMSHDRVTTQGGYSGVFKTKIYPGHHELENANRNIFAIKILRSGDRKAFEQEATILARFSNPRHAHQHLVTLLATFEHDQMFHLVFPWADADLFEFWKRQDNRPTGDKIGTWIIEQFHGLADALNTIHRYETLSGTTLFDVNNLDKETYDNEEQQMTQLRAADSDHPPRSLFGRHGDLKPENILWFPCATSSGDHGVLKITDFGATRFNTVNLWDTNKTGRIPNTATYRSPEMDLHGRLTTACDIWALGCIYLQFISWYFGGNKLVEDFGRRRFAEDPTMANINTDTFFSLLQEEGRTRAIVKPAVLKEIQTLREDPRCTEDYQTLLTMIEEDMLVVHQPETSVHETTTSVTQGSVHAERSDRPNSTTNRRKSCGNILRKIGDIKPTYDSAGNLTRRDTLEPISPLSTGPYIWHSKDA